MSLEDDVARQLFEAGEASPFAHGNSWRAASLSERSFMLRVAEEAIRLMEWSRRPGRQVLVTEIWERGRKTTRVSNPPLDLPPPDWKPPES